MVSRPLSGLSAVRKQNLLLEFTSLKYACPYGIYVSLTPGNPALWSGVLFVRKGPYAPAILRFQISFPPTYPSLPPIVTFSTDMFHPLITPLTTYMYTTDIQDSGTVSATDDERLPPGGFSLRHGFPGWFGRGARRSAEARRAGNLRTPPRESTDISSAGSPGSGRGSLSPTPVGTTGLGGSGAKISTYDVLRYIRSVFDDAEVLDRVPLEAAGNPGAWHAWRSHRIKNGAIVPTPANEPFEPRRTDLDGMSDDEENNASLEAPDRKTSAGPTSAPWVARRPGEWNWDGVWEFRVKKGIEASQSDAILFGNSAGDDLIRFLNMNDGEVETIKENIKRSLESVGIQRVAPL